MATTIAAETAKATPTRSLKERLLGQLATIFKAGADADDVSDIELRGKLHDALRAAEPGFGWVEEVRPASSTVFYLVRPADVDQTFRRTFTLDADGMVALNDDRVEVERVTEWKEITAAAAADTRTACAKCAGKQPDEPANQPAAAAEGDPNMKSKVERVAALIANEKTPFAETDKAYLEGLTDERIAALEAHAEIKTEAVVEPKVEPKAEAKVEPVAETKVAAEKKQPTEEEQLAALPPTLRSMVERSIRENKERHDALVAQLKTAQDGYSEAELKAMNIDALLKLAKAVKVGDDAVDFSLLRTSAAKDDVWQNPPDPYAAALAARAGK